MAKTTSPKERSHSLPTRLSADQEIRREVEKIVGLELQLYIEANQIVDSDLLAEEQLRLFKENLVIRGVQSYKQMQAINGISHSHLEKRLRGTMHKVSRLPTCKEIKRADIEPQILRTRFDRPPKEQAFESFSSRLPAVLKRIW